MKHDLGPLTGYAPDAVTLVTIDGREIGLIRWHEAVYAVLNLCPHAQGPVCRGVLAPGSDFEEAAAGSLICGWHRYEFDLESGRARHLPQYRLKRYPVEIAAGNVLVEVPGRAGSIGEAARAVR